MHALRRFIQERMDARAWKPADLAAASGISKQVVSGMLKDDREYIDRMPSEATITGLCRAFSVEREVLLAVIGEAMGLPVSTPVYVYDASRVPNEELVRELDKRLREAGEEHADGSAPTSEAPREEILGVEGQGSRRPPRARRSPRSEQPDAEPRTKRRRG